MNINNYISKYAVDKIILELATNKSHPNYSATLKENGVIKK